MPRKAHNMTPTQIAAIAYATRHNGGKWPAHRAVEFFAAGDVYRVQENGIFRLSRSAEHWTLNRWHRVDELPANDKADCGTTSAAPAHLIVHPKAPRAFHFPA